MINVDKEFSLHLNGYEVIAAEIISENEINKNLPAGVQYELNESGTNVFGIPGSETSIKALNGNIIGRVNNTTSLPGIKFSENNKVNRNGSFVEQANVIVPEQYHNTRFGILIEPAEKIAKDSIPQMEITVNGKSGKLKQEEENGKWFWVLADLAAGENNITYKIEFRNKAKGKISSWIFSDYEMEKTTIGKMPGNNKELLPEKPYKSGIQKMIIPVKQNEF
jgi:hypothetical protein